MKSPEIDNHKLIFHPSRVSEWFKKGDCSPIYVEIGLTNKCNHKCIFCGLDWARGTDTLKTDILLQNLEDMGKIGVKSICFSGAGEPALHPDFSLIIKKTKEFGMDVSFSTNITLFNKAIAKETLPSTSWIRFSLDAATPETHAKIHGCSKGDFPIILKNLSDAVEIKREKNLNTTLGVQFLLMEENAHEILEVTELCKKMGVDNLQIKPYSQNPNSINKFNIDYKKFIHFKKELEKFNTKDFEVFFRIKRIDRVSKNREYPHCYGLPFFAIINEKGNVLPCHLFYNHLKFAYGNIYENKFSEIWKSENRELVLKKIQQKGVKDCKRGCRLDLINSYLHRLKNTEDHDNFI